jgi:hypothetical protein
MAPRTVRAYAATPVPPTATSTRMLWPVPAPSRVPPVPTRSAASGLASVAETHADVALVVGDGAGQCSQ